jgi:alkylhydroperoxidase/carboxymuconolactone decarboxylase family protein YurZ
VGYAWSRPGLDLKVRSILTLGILAGLGRFKELGIYTKAAIANGVTIDESFGSGHRLLRDSRRPPSIPGSA